MKASLSLPSLYCSCGIRASYSTRWLLWLIITAAALFTLPAGAAPVGTSFSYQGRLTDGGQPANGSYEFEFTLYDAETGETSLGTVTREEVQVADGIFTVELDYGAAAFDGNARWLEIWVRKDNDGQPGAVLTPRQAISAAPYALMAKTVPNGAITGAKLAAGAVGSANIAAGAVGNAQLASGAVQAGNLAANSVGAAQLAAGSVTAAKLGSGAAFQNLVANDQSPVASGGVIMSPYANAPALVGAGYKVVGNANLVDEAWALKANAPDGIPQFELDTNFCRTVWTGTEWLAWGGDSNGGGRYHPATNTWTAMSTVNAPVARRYFTAVWTGTEMIIWGGGTSALLNTGARYNPATNTWTAISTTGAPSARRDHTAVWTGSQMIIWGGTTASGEVADGARYNPSTNTWSTIAAQSTPNPVTRHFAVWTGSKMVVAGGPGYRAYADYYTPATNSWTRGSAYQFGTSPYNAFAACWTGTEMILADEGRFNRINPVTMAAVSDDVDIPDQGSMVWTGSKVLFTGSDNQGIHCRSYTPATGVLQVLSNDGAASSSTGNVAWNGSRMMVLGGGGRLYDPVSDSWTRMAGTSELGSRSHGFSHVWTGSELLIWGGVDGGGTTVQGGRRYNPATNSWSLMSAVNAPAARINHSAVWTGSEMILWGGATADGEDFFYDGARYSPATDTWTALPSAGAPGVEGHRAVWTGSEMIVVGIGNPGPGIRGARYNPSTNVWTALPTLNAPALRTNFALLWTGTEVLLWGGGNIGVGNATGGRYNPATNTWTATSLVNAPPGRSHPGAVWTGTEMIVFGGGPDFGVYPTANARYNPATDTWSAITATGAPSAGKGHTCVWDGSQLIVWGGEDSSGVILNNGKIYSPESDSWAGMGGVQSIEPRTGHAGVWTGTAMLLWGGRDPLGALNSTLSYTPKRTFYFYYRP